ncbi:hypothetical protein IP91_05107 [Pseudoduganella lurida]|uniref:Uncharacterized protein n=1 Tax=Pseudoduganella lurida TaxID=1036180 RepID=A0A562QUE6_9BURK|nr:hypothetical protein [Pseudoduganella lurida]TWI60412.1 hypothetical protein IP91_05107 [Pseudoduganella lurida]
MVVHFADRYQVWGVGQERAAWRDHPLFPRGAEHGDPVFPDAGYDAGEVDAHWCNEAQPGALAVPDTDWQALAATIRADLDIPVPSSRAPAGPFIPWTRADHASAKLPLFVHNAATALAHRVLASLEMEHGTFENETNPKNDSGRYALMDEAVATAYQDWGARLEGWRTEVLLRCANERRSTVSGHGKEPFSRMTPEPREEGVATSLQPLDAASEPDQAAQGARPEPAADDASRVPASGSIGAVIVVIVLGLLSLFWKTVATLVRSSPWVIALISGVALPYVAYR